MNIALGALGTRHRGSSGPSSLVAAWKFLEGSGTTSADSSTSGNNLTLTNATWAGAQAGTPLTQAVSFSGTGGAVAENTTNQNFEWTDPFTISQWINIGSSSEYTLPVGHLALSTFAGYSIRTNDIGEGLYELFLDNGAGQYWWANVPYGTTSTWVHIVVVYDGSGLDSNVKYYVNGTLASTETTGDSAVHQFTTGSIQNTQPMELGTDNGPAGAAGFTGLIGPTYIWNRELTSGEAAGMYSNPDFPPS